MSSIICWIKNDRKKRKKRIMFLEIRSSLFYCITVSLVFCFCLFYFIPFLFCSCTKTKSYFFCFSKTKSFFFAISFFTGRDNQSCSSTRRAIWRIWVPSHLNKTKKKKNFLIIFAGQSSLIFFIRHLEVVYHSLSDSIAHKMFFTLNMYFFPVILQC